MGARDQFRFRLDKSPHLHDQLTNFTTALQPIFRSCKCGSNLLPHQESAVRFLQNHPDIKVWSTDKNLGPIVTLSAIYLTHAWTDHLHDQSTYQQLTKPSFNNDTGASNDCTRSYWTTTLSVPIAIIST
jgi:hypothetical protein